MSDAADMPYLPLLYLGKAALESLYPYIQQAVQNDMEGGQCLAELQTLENSTRAWLQSHGVNV